MKPAILFGGDVTCYVLWAVTPDGTADNLGELWVRSESDSVDFSTGLKSFAMMVTAESNPQVSEPSELVMFWNEAAKAKKAKSDPFTFSAFGPAPAIEYPSVARVIWDHEPISRPCPGGEDLPAWRSRPAPRSTRRACCGEPI